MTVIRLRFACLLFVSCVLVPSLLAQELLQAPEEMVRYKLNDLRVEKGITGNVIVFDYKRTKEGTGIARLAARTNNGPLNIMGFPIRIRETGTIRLRDMFARMRKTLGAEVDHGIEFYFITDAPATVGSSKRYLVSNVVRHGNIAKRAKARPLNEKELAAVEQDRISKLPPPEVPPGHVRSDEKTRLIVGMPILYGVMGEWQPGTVARITSPQNVDVLPEGERVLRSVKRSEWIAVSEATIKASVAEPNRFSIEIRTLPNGRVLLDRDMKALEDVQNLHPGTPLLREKLSQWETVYALSLDNQTVQVGVPRNGSSNVEFISRDQVVIREADLAAQGDPLKRAKYESNIGQFARVKSGAGGLAKPMIAGRRAVLPPTRPAPATGMAKPDDTAPADNPFALPSDERPLRTWSDATGKFQIEARLLREQEGQVWLERADARTIVVPIAKLSEADQAYLENRGKPSDNPFDNVIDGAPAGTRFDYGKPLQPLTKVGDLTWGVKSLALAPGHSLLLLGRKAASASLYELPSGNVLVDSGRMHHMGDIGVCGFTPDGSRLLLGGDRGVFEVYEISETGQLSLLGQHTLHNKAITALAISPDGRHALSGDGDKTARCWEIESGRPLATIGGFGGKVKATCILPGSTQLLATDGKTLKFCSLDEPSVTEEIEVGRSHASGQCAAFSRDGRMLATGETYNIHVWDVQERRKLGTMEGTEIPWSMVFAPDGRHLFSGGNGVVSVWDSNSRMPIQKNSVGRNSYVQAIAISPDGSRVAVPDGHRSVVVLQASP
ncbi:MAG: SHD1 domain-containing protein [Planctomycetota bacterium]